MLVTEYLTLQKKYESLYGERTVVLYAVGIFYEIWEYNPAYCSAETYKLDIEGKICNERIGHAIKLSVILNCFLTFEDTNNSYGSKVLHKIGFPIIAYDKIFL